MRRALLPPMLKTVNFPILSADGNAVRSSAKVLNVEFFIAWYHEAMPLRESGWSSTNSFSFFREMMCMVSDYVHENTNNKPEKSYFCPMKKLLTLVALACFFTGCFSFTEEIRQEPDNTYTISRTVSMGVSTFDMFASYMMMADTTGVDSVAFRRQMLDSMRHEFGGNLDSFKTYPGYISGVVRDTVIDTNFYVIASIHITDPAYLPDYHNAMWASMNKDSKSEKEKLKMVVEKKDAKTTIRYVFPPMDKETKKQSKEERKQAKEFLKDIHIYFRAISPNLEIPKGKTDMKQVPGGLEYKLPLIEILDGKKAPKQIEFVIK